MRRYNIFMFISCVCMHIFLFVCRWVGRQKVIREEEDRFSDGDYEFRLSLLSLSQARSDLILTTQLKVVKELTRCQEKKHHITKCTGN